MYSFVLMLGMAAGSGVAAPAAQTPDPAAAMAAAARAFLAALEPGQRALAHLPFNSEERLNWHFVPRARQGLSFKQMRASEQEAALALVRSSLSDGGFATVETIRRLEDVLLAIERSSIRDRDLYFVTVFGEPSPASVWGWRYEGHHVSLNWTVVDGRVAGSTPQFLGANPAEVAEGPMRGTRAVAAQEDLARALVKSLTGPQRARGVLGDEAPPDILTGASRQASAQDDRGIAYGSLDPQQQGLLLSLIQAYAAVQPPAVAAERLARVRAGLAGVRFAWMGGLEKGQGHYYRIQGPAFLVEYDNTQNHANHVHSVWREFKGDWGADELAEHYRTSPHHADYRRTHRSGGGR